MEVSGTSGSPMSILVQAAQLAGGKTAAGAGQAAGGAGKGAAAGGSGSTGQATSYDKKDANKDGVVSALEELTYDLKHPGATAESILDVKA